MVADQKMLFAVRLNQVCADRGIKPRGRRMRLASVAGVSGEAARKWLSGEAIPAMDNIASLAIFLGVNANWLLTGVEDKDNNGVGALTDEEQRHIKRLRCLPPDERARYFRVVDALVPPDVHRENAA